MAALQPVPERRPQSGLDSDADWALLPHAASTWRCDPPTRWPPAPESRANEIGPGNIRDLRCRRSRPTIVASLNQVGNGAPGDTSSLVVTWLNALYWSVPSAFDLTGRKRDQMRALWSVNIPSVPFRYPLDSICRPIVGGSYIGAIQTFPMRSHPGADILQFRVVVLIPHGHDHVVRYCESRSAR